MKSLLILLLFVTCIKAHAIWPWTDGTPVTDTLKTVTETVTDKACELYADYRPHVSLPTFAVLTTAVSKLLNRPNHHYNLRPRREINKPKRLIEETL